MTHTIASGFLLVASGLIEVWHLRFMPEYCICILGAQIRM